MKRIILNSVLMTVVTTILLGLVYPMTITGIAQLFFPENANGQIIYRDGQAIGSRIIGQPFTGDTYFHSRPSAAGSGYDAANSGGSNLGPTSKKLITSIQERVNVEQVGSQPVPIELVTASASGLDPDISPAAALYQVPRIARARGLDESKLKDLVGNFTKGRQLGVLGEPRVNVLELNLELDRLHPLAR